MIQDFPQLTRFELSITGWGETDFKTIHLLLSNSSKSLRSLSIRNKNASSVKEFLPVVIELLRIYGSSLTELTIEDVCASGWRAQGTLSELVA